MRPNSQVRAAKPRKEAQTMKLTVNLLACLAISVVLVGCGGGDEKTKTKTEKTGEKTAKTEEGSSAKTEEESTTKTEDAAEAKDIVDTAVGAGGFETLVAAVKAAGLVDTLKGEGPFTVLAPTDEAFAALPEGAVADLLKPENKDKLVAVLTYHVIPAKAMAADVVKLTSAKTVQGGDVAIKVEGDKVKVNDATVVKTDIECSNGVIHVIDAVIMPAE